MKNKNDVTNDGDFSQKHSNGASILRTSSFFLPEKPIVDAQQVDIKKQATEAFLSAFKSISKHDAQPEILSQIMACFGYYLLKYIQPPIKQFEQSCWLSANALVEHALTLNPENQFAKGCKDKILNSDAGRRYIEPSIKYRRDPVPYDHFTELFDRSVEDFLIELDTMYSTWPEQMLPTLIFLSQKIAPCLSSPQAKETLNNLYLDFQDLQCTTGTNLSMQYK
ncbi:hypothetical protein [uncultured Legionella sp.]|uniref:hypothetical protein n=1 Tax=uncultured Legionella sp. TaxID=210934 RepID=UPI002637B715|nr:hypothetical protein [uncultured Legionella sp.]